MLKTQIVAAFPDMTKKQSILGKYIIDNIREAALLNSAQIALKARVSEATITRFVALLGYKNFQDFQLELRKEAQNDFPLPSWQDLYKNNSGYEHPYQEVYDLESKIMSETFAQLDPDVFYGAVDLLCHSDKLLLVGGAVFGYLACYTYNFLSIFRDNVYAVNHVNLPFSAILSSLSEKSAALVFDYPRYPKDVQNIVGALASKNVNIIGMTDSSLAPVVPFCKYYFVTPQRYLILGEAHGAIVALIHSLIVGIYRRTPAKIKKRLEDYEDNILTLDMFEFKDYNFTKKLN